MISRILTIIPHNSQASGEQASVVMKFTQIIIGYITITSMIGIFTQIRSGYITITITLR